MGQNRLGLTKKRKKKYSISTSWMTFSVRKKRNRLRRAKFSIKLVEFAGKCWTFLDCWWFSQVEVMESIALDVKSRHFWLTRELDSNGMFIQSPIFNFQIGHAAKNFGMACPDGMHPAEFPSFNICDSISKHESLNNDTRCRLVGSASSRSLNVTSPSIKSN